MATLRKRLSGNVAVPWSTAQDGRMSYTARGVLLDVLSRPDGWEVSADRMSRACTAKTKGSGREAILSAFRELELLGYRRLVTENGDDGRIRRHAEFSDTPVEDWAAAAAGDQARRSKKPQVTPKHGNPYDGNPGPGRAGETAGHTETRQPVTRQPGTSKDVTPEGEHTPAASAPSPASVCEPEPETEPESSAPEGMRAEIGWDVTDEQVTVGHAILTATVHPEAAHLIGGADRERLAAKCGALLARGWSQQAVERVLSRRTNAGTIAPVAVLERALNDAIKESLTPRPVPAQRPARPSRAKLEKALAVADRLFPDEREFASVTAWLKRGSGADVDKWLDEHEVEAEAAPLHIPLGNAPVAP
jgi:hypothetical protein